MKTVAVILPVNNTDILTQKDLTSYNTADVKFELHYIDTDLREINNAADIEQVLELTIKKAQRVKAEGASAIIIYAFGELGVQELKDIIGVPIMALGAEAIRKASKKSKKKFTVLSGMLAHNQYWLPLVQSVNAQHNYVASKYAPELSPDQIRKDSDLIHRMFTMAEKEIAANSDIDTVTLGCGSFIGAAKPLQQRLQEKFGSAITVIDPIEVTFDLVKRLLQEKS